MKIKKKKIKKKASSEEIIYLANNILKKYKKNITIKDLNLSLYNSGYFDWYWKLYLQTPALKPGVFFS